ncbi:uncharacterized protein LOC117645502 [Thrips palmi]|uniref:Uncharacterized protein LOC117645502 n=1 Tax=Thrips palmi TaxID=161013 RepID=A0A6P8YVT7_THRPL|nr:uncharacterized protein LOC117645502 [Thrips palmi]
MGLKQCECTQFKTLDAADPPPTDRHEHYHYVQHGPTHPPQSEVRRNSNKGRTFQAQWYAKLEFSLNKMVASKTYVPVAQGRISRRRISTPQMLRQSRGGLAVLGPLRE